jgi:hypothetical protein
MAMQEIVGLIFAAVALLAAAAGLWAARAAHYAALAAREAAQRAEKLDRRTILREYIVTCHRVIEETVQTGPIIEDLKAEYRMIASWSGQSGSSREKLLIQQAENKQKEIVSIQEDVQRQLEQRGQLTEASEDNFIAALTTVDRYLIRMMRLKDGLQRELASIAGSNRFNREGRSKALNQRSSQFGHG